MRLGRLPIDLRTATISLRIWREGGGLVQAKKAMLVLELCTTKRLGDDKDGWTDNKSFSFHFVWPRVDYCMGTQPSAMMALVLRSYSDHLSI